MTSHTNFINTIEGFSIECFITKHIPAICFLIFSPKENLYVWRSFFTLVTFWLFCNLVKEDNIGQVHFALAAESGIDYCWFSVPLEIWYTLQADYWRILISGTVALLCRVPLCLIEKVGHQLDMWWPCLSVLGHFRGMNWNWCQFGLGSQFRKLKALEKIGYYSARRKIVRYFSCWRDYCLHYSGLQYTSKDTRELRFALIFNQTR